MQHHAVAGRQWCTWGVLVNSLGDPFTAMSFADIRHAGVAPHSAISVDSGILFATSFGRVVSARRHAQRRQGALDVLGGEPNLLQRLDALRFFLFGRLRYPVVNSKRFCGGRCPMGPCGRCLACRDRIQQCWCLRYIGVSSGCFGPPSLGIGNHFARRNQASK